MPTDSVFVRRRFRRRQTPPPMARFSPDGTQILTSHLNKVKLWQTSTGKLLHTLSKQYTPAILGFSPDGSKVYADGGVLNMWDTKTGKWLLKNFSLRRSTNSYRQGFMGRASVVFSPDGHYFVVRSHNFRDEIWDSRSMTLLHILNKDRYSTNVLFTSQGHRVITASDDGIVRVWHTQSGRLLCTLYACFAQDDAWVVTTPDGKYDGNVQGLRYIHYVKRNKTIAVSSQDKNRVKGLLKKVWGQF